jgi:hypothetical protein
MGPYVTTSDSLARTKPLPYCTGDEPSNRTCGMANFFNRTIGKRMGMSRSLGYLLVADDAAAAIIDPTRVVGEAESSLIV